MPDHSKARFLPRPLPWLLWALALAIAVVDQISKLVVQAYLSYAEQVPVTSFFYWTLRFNEGAAFSFLAGAGGWQRWFFTAIAAVVSLVLLVWIARIHQVRQKRWEALALTLILGGAVGNLYDRVVLGHVVDFIVWHYRQYEWPAFNIADSAICVGAALLFLDMFRGQKAQQP